MVMVDSEDTLHEHAQNPRDVPLMERPLPGVRKSPYMAEERKTWFKMGSIFVVLLSIIVLGLLSIYWGADHSLQFNSRVLTVAIIDFDEGEVGPYLQQMGAAERAANPVKSLGFVSEPGSKHDFSMTNARRALYEEEFWFGIVIQSNATTAMNYAYETGNMSYDPSGSVQVIYAQGRNSLVIGTLAYPALMSFLNDFVMKFTKQKQAALSAANAGDAAALARQAATPVPISFSIYNEAPYNPSTAEAATEIGTIYLIIISFLSVILFSSLNEKIVGKIPTRAYYIYRLLCYPVLYFFLSLFYLVLSCYWQIRFDKFFGASGYVIYWMLSWVSMTAFGLFIENINNVLGPPFTPVFFVFWVISNVATGFYPVEMLSNFYLWGLAWPLRHNLIGSKAILFGTKDVLGLNFGVILAWVAVSLALQPITIWVQLKNMNWGTGNRREILERVYGKERES